MHTLLGHTAEIVSLGFNQNGIFALKLPPGNTLNPHPQTEISSLGCDKDVVAAPRPKRLFSLVAVKTGSLGRIWSPVS
jgi:hypothetical protein